MTDQVRLGDVFRHIADRGSADAAEALSTFLNTEVASSASQVYIDQPFGAIHDILVRDSDARTAIAVIRLIGEMDGIVVIAMDHSDAYMEPLGIDDQDMWVRVVGEIANICGAHFVDSAESKLLGTPDPTPPAVACSDMEMLLPSILALAGARDEITFVTGHITTFAYDASTHIHFFPGDQTSAMLSQVCG